MVVADECRIEQEPNPCYRWNKKGEAPVMKVNRERRSISIYGGLSGLRHTVISHFCAWQNSSHTVKFLDKIKAWRTKLTATMNDTRPILLVWDNARWHKSKEVRQWLRDNPGVVELMNFPPYSPELNPQEKVWKALKQHMTDILVRNPFDDAIKHAQAFLRNHRFHYKFV